MYRIYISETDNYRIKIITIIRRVLHTDFYCEFDINRTITIIDIIIIDRLRFNEKSV